MLPVNYTMVTRLLRKQAISDVEQIITQDVSTGPTQGQTNIMENSLQNLANEGRQILRIIDDYKFKLIQSSNIFNNSPSIKAKLDQKQKILASAASLIYSIVFDMENINLTPLYEEEQFSTLDDSGSTNDEVNNEFDNNAIDDSESEDDELNDNELDENDDDDDEEANSENDNEDNLKMQGGFDDDIDFDEDFEEDLKDLDEDEEGDKK